MVNKEQKTALSFLIIYKVFERFAFYLIMAILVLYLTDKLQINENKAGQFYSIFYGVVGFSTFLFGWLGDIYNRQKLVKLGMVIMTVFYLVLIFLPANYILHLIAFIILGISIGMTISNTIVFLGNIYNERKTQILGLSGFIFYSIAISLGAFLANLLYNEIRETVGFTPILIFAFILALISFVLYLFFDKAYSKLELFAEQRKNIEPEYKNLNIIILIAFFIIGILFKLALFQKSLTLRFYIIDFSANGLDFATILHKLDNFISIVLLVIFGIVVINLKKLSWSKLFKITIIGALLGSVAYIAFAFLGDTVGQKINKTITLNFYTVLIVSETIISTVIFYTIYRVSPIRYKGLFQGLSIFIASIANMLLFIGITFSEKFGFPITFIVFSLFFIIGALVVLLVMKFVNRKEKELEEILN